MAVMSGPLAVLDCLVKTMRDFSVRQSSESTKETFACADGLRKVSEKEELTWNTQKKTAPY